MKRKLFAAACALALVGTTQAQNVLFSADFQNDEVAPMTSLNADGGAANQFQNDAWGTIVYSAGDENIFAFAGFLANGVQQEDWLYSPEITLPAEGLELSFKSLVFGTTGAELKVAVSTNGGAPDFANYTVIETLTETGVSAMEWNEHKIDLAAYANQTINVAFIHTSPGDQNYTYMLDDVLVVEKLQLDLGVNAVTMEAYPSAATQPINVSFGNFGANDITTFDVDVKVDGSVVGSETVAVTIPAGGSMNMDLMTEFTAPNYGTYTVEVEITSINGVDDLGLANNIASTVVNYWSSYPTKRALLEEGTGTWCGWCPRGAVALEMLTDTYPESFVGVAVHNGDPMTVADHDAAVSAQIAGYPGGVWEHRDAVSISPASNEAELGDILTLYSPFEISSVSTWNNTTREMTTVVSVTPVVDLNGNFKLGGVIIEDGVKGTASGYNQANYYSGGNNGNLSGAGLDWHNEPDPVPADKMVYDHVSRGLLDGGYNGKDGSLPSSLTGGTTYEYTFVTQVPASYGGVGVNALNVSVVTYVINGDNGNELSNAYLEHNPASKNVGLTEVNNGTKLDVYPNPATDFATIKVELNEATDLAVTVVNMNGAVVFNERAVLAAGVNSKNIDLSNLSKGVYLVKVTDAVSTTTKKLIVQ